TVPARAPARPAIPVMATRKRIRKRAEPTPGRLTEGSVGSKALAHDARGRTAGAGLRGGSGIARPRNGAPRGAGNSAAREHAAGFRGDGPRGRGPLARGGRERGGVPRPRAAGAGAGEGWEGWSSYRAVSAGGQA